MDARIFKLMVVAYNTRYTPVAMALVNYIHAICLICGYRGFIAENLAGVGIFPATYIFINEWGYGFCWLHKALVAYSLVMFACINFQRYIGFGPALVPAHLVIFAVGSFLFGYLILNWNDYKQNRLAC